VKDLLPVDASTIWWYADGLLRHRLSVDKDQWQIYVPEPLRRPILEEMHTKSGHLRFDKLIKTLTASFWWPKFTASVKQFLKECEACQAAIPGTVKAPATASSRTSENPPAVGKPSIWTSFSRFQNRRTRRTTVVLASLADFQTARTSSHAKRCSPPLTLHGFSLTGIFLCMVSQT
jgi:hypothetical protein